MRGKIFKFGTWDRSLTVLIPVWFGLVAVSDWFFFKKPIGFTLGLYFLLLTGALWLRGSRTLRNLPGILLTMAVGILSFLQIEHPGILHTVLSIFGLACIAIISREGWRSDALIWFRRWGVFCRRVFSQIIYDSRIIHKYRYSSLTTLK